MKKNTGKRRQKSWNYCRNLPIWNTWRVHKMLSLTICLTQ